MNNVDVSTAVLLGPEEGMSDVMLTFWDKEAGKICKKLPSKSEICLFFASAGTIIRHVIAIRTARKERSSEQRVEPWKKTVQSERQWILENCEWIKISLEELRIEKDSYFWRMLGSLIESQAQSLATSGSANIIGKHFDDIERFLVPHYTGENRADDPNDAWSQVDHAHARRKLHEFWAAWRDHLANEKATLALDEFCRTRAHRVESSVFPVIRDFLAKRSGDCGQAASGMYEIYTHVWTMHGSEQSPELLRGLYLNAISPQLDIFRSRVSACLQEILTAMQERNSAIEGLEKGFEMSIEQVKKRWQNKIEIEAIECERKRAAAMATRSSEAPFRLLDESYRCISFMGTPQTLNPCQSKAIRRMHEAYVAGIPYLHQKQILEAAGQPPTSRLRDCFTNTGLWKTLIVEGDKKGTFRLNLQSPIS